MAGSGTAAISAYAIANRRSWRIASRGYGAADGVRQKFTGYEREVEIGLDYAQARYYANSQGRFTSADPLLASARPGAPQTWNRYAYVGNNPLSHTDPTGMDGVDDPSVQGTPANRQQQQRQQQSQSPPAAGPPPVSSALAGSPAFQQQNPIPAGMSYHVGEQQRLINQHQTYAGGVVANDYMTGVVRNVAVTIVDDSGAAMTDSSGVTAQEVITTEIPSAAGQPPERIAQNTRAVAPDANGIIPDTLIVGFARPNVA